MFASHVYIHYRPYRLYTLYIYVVIICVRVYIHTHKYNIYIYTYTYTTDISESCYHVLFIPSLHPVGPLEPGATARYPVPSRSC